MKATTLTALREAQAAKRAAVLIRPIPDGDETLLVDGAVVAGTAPEGALAEAVAKAVARDTSGMVETEAGPVFVQVFNPPLRLLIVGAVHIAQVLAPMASLTGYDVTVIDPRQAFASDARFPGIAVMDDWPDDALVSLAPDHRTAVVTLTHDPKLDDPALDVALRSNAFYIAALGSRRTHAARRERLGALGHDDAAFARINGPAGLAIGAISPAEIALSVMAEMTQTVRGAPALAPQT